MALTIIYKLYKLQMFINIHELPYAVARPMLCATNVLQRARMWETCDLHKSDYKMHLTNQLIVLLQQHFRPQYLHSMMMYLNVTVVVPYHSRCRHVRNHTKY